MADARNARTAKMIAIIFDGEKSSMEPSLRARLSFPQYSTVIRADGRSSTPRPIDSISVVSGILDRPAEPGDDTVYDDGSGHTRSHSHGVIFT
jgi:hypothetical protein